MIEIAQVSWDEAEQQLSAIRREVFIEEQQVPEELEWDGEDEQAFHLLAYSDGKTVATVRMLADGHIGRMAVLSEYRDRGIGSRLLQAIVELARQQGLPKVELDAQTHALDFYRKQGFIAEGGVFMDAGIPHRHMQRRLV